LATGIALPVTLVGGLAAFWLFGGFDSGRPATGAPTPGPTGAASSAVAMPAPSLADHAATVCRALLSRLPGSLRDQARRPVNAGPEQNAAYGDPAITLACAGGPAPSVDPTAYVFLLSGVCWYPLPGSGGTRWTTVDREVPVTVTVPERYTGPAQWVIEFSGPVLASVPSVSTVPTGCGRSPGPG
jgi:hypothetical protein